MGVLASLFMIFAPLISDPSLGYLYGLLVLSVGLIVYVVFVRGRRKLPLMGECSGSNVDGNVPRSL